MTACTNNGGSRARRAVTAALVGVLSVGAAPMVALATEAAPVAGDVQLQAMTADTIWNGIVTYKGEDSYVYNGDPQGKEAVSIDPAGDGDPMDLEYTPQGRPPRRAPTTTSTSRLTPAARPSGRARAAIPSSTRTPTGARST